MPGSVDGNEKSKKKGAVETGATDKESDPTKEDKKKDNEEEKREEGKNKTLADEMKEAVHQQKEESKSDGEELTFFERQEKDEHYSVWNLDYWL